jgi:glucose/arabinose dehydrogenase
MPSPLLRPAIVAALLCTIASAAVAQTVDSERHRFRLNVVVAGLEHPWGLAFLPNGDLLITERPGRLRLVRGGVLDPKPVPGAPEAAASGQGGLLDVALHPRFAENRLVYLSYAGRGEGGLGTEVAHGRLVEGRLEDLETIYVAQPKSRGGRHFGSRLVFGADGLLYVTSGERGSPDRAQDLGDPAGAVLRLTEDGKPAPGNPFLGRPGARPEIFSTGHRNPQGLTTHPETGAIWAVEHGPRGGDELNLITAGTNYGWPVITHGRSYAGFKIGEGKAKPGMAQPVRYWVPSISPSGLAFYTGAAFPEWRGSLFLGALSGEALVRLELDGTKVVHEERLLEDLGERIRDVRQGPDGRLYLLTDSSDGALLRLDPVP